MGFQLWHLNANIWSNHFERNHHKYMLDFGVLCILSEIVEAHMFCATSRTFLITHILECKEPGWVKPNYLLPRSEDHNRWIHRFITTCKSIYAAYLLVLVLKKYLYVYIYTKNILNICDLHRSFKSESSLKIPISHNSTQVEIWSHSCFWILESYG